MQAGSHCKRASMHCWQAEAVRREGHLPETICRLMVTASAGEVEFSRIALSRDEIKYASSGRTPTATATVR